MCSSIATDRYFSGRPCYLTLWYNVLKYCSWQLLLRYAMLPNTAIQCAQVLQLTSTAQVGRVSSHRDPMLHGGVGWGGVQWNWLWWSGMGWGRVGCSRAEMGWRCELTCLLGTTYVFYKRFRGVLSQSCLLSDGVVWDEGMEGRMWGRERGRHVHWCHGDCIRRLRGSPTKKTHWPCTMSL